MFIHLLTFLFQVGADYTIDERFCFLVCGLLLTSAIVGFIIFAQQGYCQLWLCNRYNNIQGADCCLEWYLCYLDLLWRLHQSACRALSSVYKLWHDVHFSIFMALHASYIHLTQFSLCQKLVHLWLFASPSFSRCLVLGSVSLCLWRQVEYVQC